MYRRSVTEDNGLLKRTVLVERDEGEEPVDPKIAVNAKSIDHYATMLALDVKHDDDVSALNSLGAISLHLGAALIRYGRNKEGRQIQTIARSLSAAAVDSGYLHGK